MKKKFHCIARANSYYQKVLPNKKATYCAMFTIPCVVNITTCCVEHHALYLCVMFTTVPQIIIIISLLSFYSVELYRGRSMGGGGWGVGWVRGVVTPL